MSAKRPTPPAVAHPWEFKARFRRHAFGWKSQPAITRVKQAVAEVKKVAKKDPAVAAEGAIAFLKRVSPALEHVDSALDWATLLRLVMQRWRTGRVYEDLKGELGLDHYEGRRFPGWHHHVSVALCCYAFIVAERARHFPPSARGAVETHTHPLSA